MVSRSSVTGTTDPRDESEDIRKNMVEQYNISATSNILGSPGVDLGPRKYGESGVNEEFPKYRALVGSLI